MSWPKKGDRLLPFSVQSHLLLRSWSAYRCMVLGTARRDEWADLADTINIVEALCDSHHIDAGGVMPEVRLAISGMKEAMESEHAADGMRMPADSLAALGEICDRYDLALQRLSANTVADAKARFVEEVLKHAAAPDSSTLLVMA